MANTFCCDILPTGKYPPQKKRKRGRERKKLFNPHSLKINKKLFDDIIYIQTFKMFQNANSIALFKTYILYNA